MKQVKRPLLILTGPTAVGKTKLSIALAKRLNGSVISADSMQVYRRMDIGSAKITPGEMEGVPHYLVDALEPEEEFHVARFQSMAKEAMEEIYGQGRLPIVVGGTGFYIQALLKDVDFSEESGASPYRAGLEAMAAAGEGDKLYRMLCEADPASAEKIHPNNSKRVIRALEYYHETGKPISRHNAEQMEKEPPYRYGYFVLNDVRSRLYERIGERVDRMMEQGLLEEVQGLNERGCHRGMVSMQGLGYKELLAYLDGECTLEEAVEIIKRDTRRFAKRQITWFKRERDVVWLDKQAFGYDEEAILEKILSVWRERQQEEDS